MAIMPRESHMKAMRWCDRSLAVAAGFLAIAFTFLLLVACRTLGQAVTTSGVWTATAVDASHGILYRPIESPLGYGGSRYAPLHIAVQGGLIAAGLAPIAAGLILNVAGFVLAICGLFFLMDQLAVPRATALALSALALGTHSAMAMAGGIRGDLLATALNLWGLAIIVRAEASRRRPALLAAAGLCFALSIAAKLTSVFGLGSSILWLLFRRRPGKAAALAAVSVGALAVMAIATQLASGGRALAVFRACATAGGGTHELLNAPLTMLKLVLQSDRLFLILLAIAAGILLGAPERPSLPIILFFTTLAGTVAIFGSPGTMLNHLFDLSVAALLLVAVKLPNFRWRVAATVALAALGFYAGVACLRQANGLQHKALLSEMRAALAIARKSPVDGPMFANDPILPILDGQTPYLLDPFMFSVIRKKNPHEADRLMNDLSNRRFKSVVLTFAADDPNNPDVQDEFEPGFTEALRKNYRLQAQCGSFWVYLPLGAGN
jgi:hypothetical protein